MTKSEFAVIIWSIWVVGLLILEKEFKILKIGVLAFSLVFMYTCLFP
jgi:hypothetical protein